jgi:predicted CXXCH cytochrome family protein
MPARFLKLAAFLLLLAAPAAAAGKDQCVACHTEIGDALAAPVNAMRNDVHAQHGLSCASCHGGDSSTDDLSVAKSPKRGFVGKPSAKDTPRFCGKCHSDAAFMKQYNPAQRIDQEAEYFTSVHGRKLREGDGRVATCTSCHGAHGIRPVKDPAAPVYALNVAQTCGRCHGNPEYMRPYGIATDQPGGYAKSVHAAALTKKGDLSAPTCNDCHGNHGAAPPGLTSVANVCGTCHARQSELFLKSPHKAAFDALQAAACVVCHSNHEVRPPTDALLGTGKEATCLQCHGEGDAGFVAAGSMRRSIDDLAGNIRGADQLLTRAVSAGMEVSRAQFELQDARDKLIHARVVIHSASLADVDAVVRPGLEVARKVHRAGVQALEDLRFRRKGLVASLFVIGIAVVALALKIRQIESERPEEES